MQLDAEPGVLTAARAVEVCLVTTKEVQNRVEQRMFLLFGGSWVAATRASNF